jgi:hypothetical protein
LVTWAQCRRRLLLEVDAVNEQRPGGIAELAVDLAQDIVTTSQHGARAAPVDPDRLHDMIQSEMSHDPVDRAAADFDLPHSAAPQ